MKNGMDNYYKYEVGFGDCDAYQIAHNARYVQWFEQGIYKYFMADKEALLKDKRLIFTEIRYRYLHAIKFGDRIEIYTDIKKDKNDRSLYEFYQTILKEESKKIVSICKGIVRVQEKNI
jgi:YbgC/YbaW family acyl-CoA thioester hydrolase